MEDLNLRSILNLSKDLFYLVIERLSYETLEELMISGFIQRDPKIEEIIFNYSPGVTYDYVKNVVKERLPEAEERLSQNPTTAYNYAVNILKGRFPKGEKTIMMDPKLAYLYAKNILKQPWPEAETYISRSSIYEDEYEPFVRRWKQKHPGKSIPPVITMKSPSKSF